MTVNLDRLPSKLHGSTGYGRVHRASGRRAVISHQGWDGNDMSHMQLLAKGAGQGSPPFWIIAIVLIVIVGMAFLVTRARRR